MQTRLNPYISFKDNTRHAMEFYKTIFGGELTMSTFKESDPTSNNDGIMHAMIVAENGIVIMAADTPPGMEYEDGARVSMSLSGDNESEMRGYWEKLSEGAAVIIPLEKAPWGDTFGMLNDKFGVKWMVNIMGMQA